MGEDDVIRSNNMGEKKEYSYATTIFMIPKDTDIRKITVDDIDPHNIILEFVGGDEAYELKAQWGFDNYLNFWNDDPEDKEDYDGPIPEVAYDPNYKKAACIRRSKYERGAFLLFLGRSQPVFWADEYGNIAYEKITSEEAIE